MQEKNKKNIALSFKNLSSKDVAIAGGKGASLGEMMQSGISIPEGFVILSSAFENFLEQTDLNVEIDSILHQVNYKEIHTTEDASKKINALILNAEMPKVIANEIQEFFKTLNTKYVAVRSSATAEDSTSAAWAGQLDSYLNTTEIELLKNVKKCWASLFTPRAIFYRFEKGLCSTKISVAVVVQKMVNSEISGVAFSVHPVTEDRNQLIIEAGFGLGEAIVSGQITPDSYVVKKEPRNILDINISTQNRALYRINSGGNEWKNISEPQASSQVLNEKQILELADLIIKIENHYGFPCDIEWAFEKGKFYIVQSRPITTLIKRDENSLNQLGTVKIFTKEHSREYSFFRLASWHSSMTEGMKKIVGVGMKEACGIYNGGDLVSIYYEPDELKKVFESILKKCQEKEYMIGQIKNFLDLFSQLKQYYIGKKKIKDLKDLRKVQELYAPIWAYTAIVFMIPSLPVDEELKKIALDARKKTQEYNETPEIIFEEALKIFFPKLKGKTRFILPEEIWSGEVESPNFIKKINERKKGFIYYKEKIYTGNLQENLDKLGIKLEDKKSVVSGEAQYKGNEIKGQIAYKGIAKGVVKKVSKVFDINKVKKGDILVAAMTMPKYLPAMKKAIAFITDEGGITCHAAIIAREMKKPCIIGTKIATQILKDGDIVEVDADNGVVRLNVSL
ncbi:MAG: PEP/pyruvate-binding domain-containing protein [bacterium]|nr:PEP/pyruvate-binding domain-containing protein [bacterium]